jgi:hypothetical protein
MMRPGTRGSKRGCSGYHSTPPAVHQCLEGRSHPRVLSHFLSLLEMLQVTVAVNANYAAGNEATQMRFFRLFRLSFDSPGGTSMLERKELVVILICGPMTFT